MQPTATLFSLFAIFNMAAASVIITPVFADQVLKTKLPRDCPYGVVTPQGCAPLRKKRKTSV